MSLRPIITGILALAATGGIPAGAQPTPTPPAQDPEVLRFVARAEPWYPDSSFRITADKRTQTPSGTYRVVVVERQCASKYLSGSSTLVVDEVARVGWLGSLAKLPFKQAGIAPNALGHFLEGFLPEAMRSNFLMKIRVDWGNGPHRAGALIPFWMLVDTGYGEFRQGAAVTSDGEYLILGASFPMNSDPVTYRRQLLDSSDLVMWDHVPADGAKVEIVEFSDLECPACRAKWPLVKKVLDAYGASVKHGMVSLPLTTIHPWSFRAACASWCVASQNPTLLLPFKELFYSLQSDMEVALVTPTAVDFVAGNGLDEERFNACYLRPPSLNAVHSQLQLGQSLGVLATPTYFVNGWKIQVPEEGWFDAMIKDLVAGHELQ
jgi:protein-disulfide isomerase